MIVPSHTYSLSDWGWRTQLKVRRTFRFVARLNAVSAAFVWGVSLYLRSYEFDIEYIIFIAALFLFFFVLFFDVLFMVLNFISMFVVILHCDFIFRKIKFSMFNFMISVFVTLVLPVIVVIFLEGVSLFFINIFDIYFIIM
jgi:hypothetical protein